MKKRNHIKLSSKLTEPQIAKVEFYDGLTWQTLASECYVDDKSLQTYWDLLNDNTEVIWQQP